TGRVDANIAVAASMINGMVNGDIIATEKIELGRTARVVGNIQTPRLVIEDGAILEGSCTMTKAREAMEKRNADINSQYSSAAATATTASSTYQTGDLNPAEEYAEIADDDEE